MHTYAQLGPAGVRARLEEQSKGAPLSRSARKVEYSQRLLVMAERFDSLVYQRIAQVYAKESMRAALSKFVDAGANVMLRAVRDLVDPHPSLERLREALRPGRTLRFPWTGHAGVTLRRAHELAAVHGFLEENGALTPASRRAQDRTVARS